SACSELTSPQRGEADAWGPHRIQPKLIPLWLSTARLPKAPLHRHRLCRLVVLVLAGAAARIDGLRIGIALPKEEEAVAAEGAAIAPAIVAGHLHRRRGRLAGDEAALRVVAQDRNELGAVVGLGAERLVRDDDRGPRQRGRRDAIPHLLRDRDAIQRVLGTVALVDADDAPAQASVALRHRREDMRADRL